MGFTEQLKGLEVGGRCSVPGLEKLQKFGGKRHVFTTEACLQFHQSGTQLAHSLCCGECGYFMGASRLKKLCKRSELSQAVMAGYTIYDLFKKLSLLYLKGFC